MEGSSLNKLEALVGSIVTWLGGLTTLVVVALLIGRSLGAWQWAWLQAHWWELMMYLLCDLCLIWWGSQLRATAATNAITARQSLAEQLARWGVVRAYDQDTGPAPDPVVRPATAKSIDLISINGYVWYLNNEPWIRQSLKSGCQLRMLICAPDSCGVRSREDLERRRPGAIAAEVESMTEKLRCWQREYGSRRVQWGHTDHCITSRVEIIDKSLIYWCPYLPPARAMDSCGFAVGSGQTKLAKALRLYFDAYWETRTVPDDPQ